jgi:Ca2+-binding EF-hand superfamily protein
MKAILSATVGVITLAAVYFAPLITQGLSGAAMADESGPPPMDGGSMEHGEGHRPWGGHQPWGAKCEGDVEKCRAEMQARMQEHFKEQFKKADTDGNGTLSKAEAEQGMPMLARNFDEIDTNKDGQITFEEFTAYGKKKMEEFSKHRDECKADPDKCHAEMFGRMKEQFKKADVNGDGVLTMAEAEKGAPMIAHRFSEMDTNKDGQVSLKEFETFHYQQYEKFKKQHAQALDRLEKQFKKADVNHDGMLSMAEAEKGMPDLAKCFADVDANHDGMISLEEAKSTIPMHPDMGHGHGDGMMKGPHGHGDGMWGHGHDGMPPGPMGGDDEQHFNTPPPAPSAM